MRAYDGPVALETADAYVARRPDGIWERQLSRDLEAAPEPACFAFLADALRLCEQRHLATRPWLELARKHVTRPHFVELLRIGFELADASTMKAWVEMAGRRLGCTRLLAVLGEEEATYPSAVQRTLYWLPVVARSAEDNRAVRAFVTARKRVR